MGKEAGETVLQWHPAFFAGIQIEFGDDEGNELERKYPHVRYVIVLCWDFMFIVSCAVKFEVTNASEIYLH